VKIYVYPGDQWGCGSYRMIWPAEAVGAQFPEWDVVVVDPQSRSVSVKMDFSGRVYGESFPADADAVLLQRPTTRFLYQALPMLRARGVAVIVDMDDDLARIHPSNPAFRTLAKFVPHPANPRMPMQNMHSARNASLACAAAGLVTVTTPQLASRYGSNGNAVVVPNYVPEWYLNVPHVDSDLVGWGGSVHSHPDDLQQVGAAVQQLVAAGGRFETVGQPDGVGRALGLAEDPPSSGPVGLDEWPRSIAQFGIGIAPLADTAFNQAKSRLKPLEYAAVGVPCVASPTADYQAWATECAGTVTADRPRKWAAILRALVADEGRRLEMSEAGRSAAALHTIEGNAWRWAEAWEAAVTAQRAKVPAGAT